MSLIARSGDEITRNIAQCFYKNQYGEFVLLTVNKSAHKTCFYELNPIVLLEMGGRNKFVSYLLNGKLGIYGRLLPKYERKDVNCALPNIVDSSEHELSELEKMKRMWGNCHPILFRLGEPINFIFGVLNSSAPIAIAENGGKVCLGRTSLINPQFGLRFTSRIFATEENFLKARLNEELRAQLILEEHDKLREKQLDELYTLQRPTCQLEDFQENLVAVRKYNSVYRDNGVKYILSDKIDQFLKIPFPYFVGNTASAIMITDCAKEKRAPLAVTISPTPSKVCHDPSVYGLSPLDQN